MPWDINQTRRNCQYVSPPGGADANSSPEANLFVLYSSMYAALISLFWAKKNVKFPLYSVPARPNDASCNDPVSKIDRSPGGADANSSPTSLRSFPQMSKDLSKLRSEEIKASKTFNCDNPTGRGAAPLVPTARLTAGAAGGGREGV